MNGTGPGDSHEALMPGGPPRTVDIELDASPATIMSGGQPHIRDFEPGASPRDSHVRRPASYPYQWLRPVFIFVAHGSLPLGQAPAADVSYLAHAPDGLVGPGLFICQRVPFWILLL